MFSSSAKINTDYANWQTACSFGELKWFIEWEENASACLWPPCCSFQTDKAANWPFMITLHQEIRAFSNIYLPNVTFVLQPVNTSIKLEHVSVYYTWNAAVFCFLELHRLYPSEVISRWKFGTANTLLSTTELSDRSVHSWPTSSPSILP